MTRSGASSRVGATDWLTLSEQQVPQWLQLPVTVEAIAASTVSAQTSGRIIELPYDVNDLVPQGAVIVRFTDTEQQARLRQAQAAAQVTFGVPLQRQAALRHRQAAAHSGQHIVQRLARAGVHAHLPGSKWGQPAHRRNLLPVRPLQSLHAAQTRSDRQPAMSAK